jgi:hypothetical protein
MTIVRLRDLTLASILIAVTVAPAMASTPTPKPTATPKMPTSITITQPTVPLHTEYAVKVNKKGQVVSSKPLVQSKSSTVNTMTFGNSLQMWIREADGTAKVGTFKVSYDYDPKTKKVSRQISLISLGGDWGDKPGAATQMMDTAKREYEQAQKQHEQEVKSLPSLNQITGHSPSPSPAPTHHP